jgi:hypothetical protein
MYIAWDDNRAVGLLFARDETELECLITVDLDQVGIRGWKATVARVTYPYADRPTQSFDATSATSFLVKARPRGRGKH